MRIAWEISRRATCDRLHVGCVIVDNDRSILATGYNGSVVGRDHCDDAGHDLVNGHCVRTVHAEQNAIAQAARRGTALSGAIAYVTAYPCWPCAKLLANSGVHIVRFARAYRVDPRVASEFNERIMHVDLEDPVDELARLKKNNEDLRASLDASDTEHAKWRRLAGDRAASLERLTPKGNEE
jgi:dCMP deaminase